MTEWRKVKLGEVCRRVTSGGTPKATVSSYYYPPTIPWLNTKEIDFCRITKTENYISEEGYEKSSAKWIDSDSVIIAMYGNTAGKVAINKIPLTTNQACCNLTINEDIADYEFIYYQLCTLYDKMVSLKIGAAQLNLNAQLIKNLEIILPPLPVQRRIAEVLSRYDALIENYQRQIKLLEEAAQRLYKEWFVDLRFPGHQSTPIINNLPQSWQKKKLAEIARLKAGGDKPKVFSSEKSFELTIPVYSNGTINEGLYGYTDTAEINVPCVTISARGSVGYTVLRRTPFVPIVRLISVIPDDIYVGYLFFYIKDMPLDSNGAAQQQITVPMIKNKEIIVPENGVLNGFRNQVEPFFITVDCLKRSIRNLSEARDRLLPKLMSAEIEV